MMPDNAVACVEINPAALSSLVCKLELAHGKSVWDGRWRAMEEISEEIKWS